MRELMGRLFIRQRKGWGMIDKPMQPVIQALIRNLKSRPRQQSTRLAALQIRQFELDQIMIDNP